MNKEERPDNGEPKSGSYGLILCEHESDGHVYTSYPPQMKCRKCGDFYRERIAHGTTPL